MSDVKCIYCVLLRGDDETDLSMNQGNFLELLNLLSKYDPQIKARIDSLPRNAKMLSAEIQNDLLSAATSVLLSCIKKEVHEARYYAIIADEMKDVSKKELLGVSLRYVVGTSVLTI